MIEILLVNFGIIQSLKEFLKENMNLQILAALLIQALKNLILIVMINF